VLFTERHCTGLTLRRWFIHVAKIFKKMALILAQNQAGKLAKSTVTPYSCFMQCDNVAGQI